MSLTLSFFVFNTIVDTLIDRTAQLRNRVKRDWFFKRVASRLFSRRDRVDGRNAKSKRTVGRRVKAHWKRIGARQSCNLGPRVDSGSIDSKQPSKTETP